MTRREVLQDILAFLIGQKLAKREPKQEDFDNEVGLDEDGIVIRPPERKKG
jgi:hypothetical protein